uniref:TIR domain-containing protein n=1 Tax=Biomphalaria glabrata TaxID=6526 RepID=A0A2C9KPV0_BIOGL
MTECNCSRLGLIRVPDYLPVSVMFLDLSFNQILTIVNCSFCNYTDLTELNLSNNIIDLLTIETFSRLFKLKRLNLAGNNLNYVMSTFPEGVFSDLISLTTLYLHYNAKDCESSCSYPDSTLSELTQLETLSLDGISPFILGPKFKDLINLRNLTFSMEICNIDALTSTTFLNVGQITSLNLTNCNILGLKVSNNTFTPLVHLNSLDVSNNNKLRVKHLFRVLRSIQTYNITELKFNYVEPFYSTSIIIDDIILEGLPRSLKILEGKGNHFETIRDGLLQKFPTNLTYVDLENNNFFFGAYLRDLHCLENLEVLKLSKRYENGDVASRSGNDLSKFQVVNDCSRTLPFPCFMFPPKLKYLYMVGGNLKGSIRNLFFSPNNSLIGIKLVNNYFPSLIGPLEPYFSLMELNVSKRNKLQTLDLSGNAITKMHADIFAGLTNLRILYFEINSMWIFHLNIGHMMNLQYVHMRHSQISSFSLEVRQHIDVLCRNKSRVVEIDLSLNPIRCDCDNYDFIQWMVSSRAFDPTFADYICQYADSSFKNITDAYEETLRELQRKRTDNSLTLLFVIAATFIMVAFVIAGIIYRFRWKLRYIYYATYLKLKHSEQEHHGQFRYDVFISYAHQDEEFILKDVYP